MNKKQIPAELLAVHFFKIPTSPETTAPSRAGLMLLQSGGQFDIP